MNNYFINQFSSRDAEFSDCLRNGVSHPARIGHRGRIIWRVSPPD